MKNNYGTSVCLVCGRTFKLFQTKNKTCSGRCAGKLSQGKAKKLFQFKDTGFFEWENYPNGVY